MLKRPQVSVNTEAYGDKVIGEPSWVKPIDYSSTEKRILQYMGLDMVDVYLGKAKEDPTNYTIKAFPREWFNWHHEAIEAARISNGEHSDE